MRSIVFRRPATGTVFGLIAIVIASVGSITAIRAGGSTTVIQPAPPKSTFILVEHPFTLAKSDTDIYKVNCPANYKVVSGGWRITNGNVLVAHNYPNQEANGWVVALYNNPRLIIQESTGEVFAICAKKGPMVR